MDERDNVIHVAFGRDGSHRRLAPPTQSPPEARRTGTGAVSADRKAGPSRERPDPLADLYDRKEVARLFGMKEGRLRYWDRTGFIAPTARVGRRRLYSFQDLISIRAAHGLIEQGVPSRQVRISVEALRRALPRVVRPLSELRVVADGRSLVVQDQDGAFEPVTGQLVLDFRVDALRDDVVRLLRQPRSQEQRRAAYEYYLRGCRLDEDASCYDEAEAAYREAIRLDPSFANALTNLGNLRYRRGDLESAEALYRQALSLDAEQPEAHYNIGFLRFEEALFDDAIASFRQAVELDPSFADAHFNLALAIEEVGGDAQECWSTYLALDPNGIWADIARQHLRKS